MVRDITIGQYYPVDSFIHRLDPRVKLGGTVIFIVSLFLFNSFYGFIPALLFMASVIIISKVPLKFIVRGMKPVLFLLLFTMTFNILLTPGDILWQWGILRITREGLRIAGFMGIRLTFLVLGSSLMTFTTTPNQLTDGLEKAFRPLRILHVPVHEMAMMMSIALRFIPILLEETDKIIKAQQARGADFETGNLFKRAKAMIPILVPLFISAFRRAGDLAMAMEARCYHGGKGRTKMKPLKYTTRDLLVYLILLGYLAGVILLNIFVF